VDDACPNESGKFVQQYILDSRIKIIFHKKNQGVGGAVMSGYQAAILDNVDIVVKIDGDGQMDPLEIKGLITELVEKSSDYAKGNRFYSLENLRKMPTIRVLGNIVLSFMSKISTGYYEIFDPNNGFTVITKSALKKISLQEVSDRYFFESDMLFQLNLARCKVIDVPMKPIYGDEKSNLKVRRAALTFLNCHTKNFFKRILYTYFIRDFNIASLQLLSGVILFTWGFITGLSSWLQSKSSGEPSQTGTLILVAILVVSGIQLLLSFLNNDMASNRNNS
jgi:glycosyltransferase involved in cell wall biosynthesis